MQRISIDWCRVVSVCDVTLLVHIVSYAKPHEILMVVLSHRLFCITSHVTSHY